MPFNGRRLNDDLFGVGLRRVFYRAHQSVQAHPVHLIAREKRSFRDSLPAGTASGADF
jgi:hypothetical protein